MSVLNTLEIKLKQKKTQANCSQLSRTFACLIFSLAVAAQLSCAHSQDIQPNLAWPLDCIPGESCNKEIGYPDINNNNRAFNCLQPGYRGHHGTDIIAAKGTDVLAAEDGTVLWVFDGKHDDCPSSHPDCQAPLNDKAVPGYNKGFRACTVLGSFCGDGNPNNGQCYYCFDGGNIVVIKHEKSTGVFATRYDHFKTGSISVSIGDTVSKGDKIGEVASAGRSTAPHLHFEVWGKGFYDLVDPWAGSCGTNKTRPMWQTGTNTPWK